MLAKTLPAASLSALTGFLASVPWAKAAGMNLIVWLLPGVLVAAGIAFVVIYVKRQQRAPAPPPPPGSAPAAPTEDPYLRAVRSEIEK